MTLVRIYCPSCGSLHNDAANFCKRCGCNLARHLALLNDDLPTQDLIDMGESGPANTALSTAPLADHIAPDTVVQSTILVADADPNHQLGILNALLHSLERDVRIGATYARFPLLPTLRYATPSMYVRAQEEDALAVLSADCQAALRDAFEAMVAFGTYAQRYTRNYAEEQLTGHSTQALLDLGPRVIGLAKRGISLLELELERLGAN